jgi:glycosyltransferase involved in cell wall biosynthesis
MEKAKPRISIGLPVYNGEKYVGQALDSILAQTYADFEVIISDNASTDRTRQICQAYAAKDGRIRYYRSEHNLGAAPNFNRVFELSSGAYFKWAAHDDVIAPEFLSKCIEVLDQNPAVVLCFPKSRIIDENGQSLGVHEFKAEATSPKPHIRFRNLALNPDTAFQVFGLMRANVAGKTALIGNYPASDLVFLAELALYGQFYEIPEPLFCPRYHPEQSTKRDLRVERDRVVWFDTSLKDKILLPKWLYLFGYLEAIGKAPVGRYERMYCYAQMIRWTLIPPHCRALGKDVLLASVRFVRVFPSLLKLKLGTRAIQN